MGLIDIFGYLSCYSSHNSKLDPDAGSEFRLGVSDVVLVSPRKSYTMRISLSL